MRMALVLSAFLLLWSRSQSAGVQDPQNVPGQTQQRFQFVRYHFEIDGKDTNVALKLDRRTGDVWRLEGDDETRWKLVAEEKDAAKLQTGLTGRYVLFLFGRRENDRELEIPVRIDQYSGQTWRLDWTGGGRWAPIPEGKDADRPASSGGVRYLVATLNFSREGTDHEHYLRFDRCTGRVWKFDRAGPLQWEPVPEANDSEPPNASSFARYTWGVVASSKGSAVDLYLRLDSLTGRTWKLDPARSARWEPLPEPKDSQKPTAGNLARYHLYCHNLVKDGAALDTYLRFDYFTGQTWRFDAAVQQGWELIPEPKDQPKLPAANTMRYQIANPTLTRGGTDQEIYVRLDTFSGQTWKFAGTGDIRWDSIPEAKDKSEAGDSPRFGLFSNPAQGKAHKHNWFLYDIRSGKTWRCSTSDATWEAVKQQP